MTSRYSRPLQPIQLTVTIPPKYVPALERTVESEQRKNLSASPAQLLDTIFLRGLIFTHDAIAAGIALTDPEKS